MESPENPRPLGKYPTPPQSECLQLAVLRVALLLRALTDWTKELTRFENNGHQLVYQFEFLCQTYFGFVLFSWSRDHLIVNLISGTYSREPEYSLYNRVSLQSIGTVLCHICNKLQQIFERKLDLFWFKEPLIQLQKNFRLCCLNGKSLK